MPFPAATATTVSAMRWPLMSVPQGGAVPSLAAWDHHRRRRGVGQRLVDGVGGTITGGLSSNGGDDLVIAGTTIGRSVLINSMIGRVSIEQAQVAGAVSLRNNITGDSPIVVAANRIRGLLSCTQNTPAATNQARINTVYGPESGQCFNL